MFGSPICPTKKIPNDSRDCFWLRGRDSPSGRGLAIRFTNKAKPFESRRKPNYWLSPPLTIENTPPFGRGVLNCGGGIPLRAGVWLFVSQIKPNPSNPDESQTIGFLPRLQLKTPLPLGEAFSIAGAGFEPATSRLWASRAARLLYPALIIFLSYFPLLFILTYKLNIVKWCRRGDSNSHGTSPHDFESCAYTNFATPAGSGGGDFTSPRLNVGTLHRGLPPPLALVASLLAVTPTLELKTSRFSNFP